MSAPLAALQARFLEALLDGAELPDRVAPRDAVDFYRSNVHANLRAALAAAYPVVERLVGAPFFTEMARAYASRVPSAQGDLHGHGARLAEFVADYGPARSLAYLPDVARLEWAVHESAAAIDAGPFDAASLARLPAEDHPRMRVRLAPSVRRIDSMHAVVAIWEANQPGRDGTPGRDGAELALVHRPAFDVNVRRIDAASARLIDALAHGRTLAEAADALGDEAERLPALLSQWMAEGVIAAFEPPAPAR